MKCLGGDLTSGDGSLPHMALTFLLPSLWDPTPAPDSPAIVLPPAPFASDSPLLPCSASSLN